MIADRAERKRAATETGTSFVVEASAGTGKTTTLVDRTVHLVLGSGPQGNPVEMRRIAAITFTEKAAGEMKLRLRREFEKHASDAGEAGTRASRALRDLEAAPISTIHAFAVALLKERPVEAGLDPRFQALDEIQSELLFREAWQIWLDQALRERSEPLERALRAGLGLDTLESLARELRKHSQIVQDLSPITPLSDAQVLEQLVQILQKGKSYHALANDSSDKLADKLKDSLGWLAARVSTLNEHLRTGKTAAYPWEALDCSALAKSGNAGKPGNWTGGAGTVADVRAFNNSIVDFCKGLAALPMQRLVYELDRWVVRDFLPAWENRKRSEGFLDFDDQLLLARDLLLKNPAVRRDFQRQFGTILVDEFQDTDPVQLSIVLLLASRDLETADPTALKPEPGRFFAVGDPKQSIYRFRRADIETYLKVAQEESMKERGIERVALTTNFRSVPSILRFVDAAFAERMALPADGRYQPDYAPFREEGARRLEPDAPSVYILPDRIEETDPDYPVGAFSEREAMRVATLIRQMLETEGWKVADRSAAGGERAEVRRMPRNDDIAILVPALTKVDLLENALREARINYVLEGGKFYYQRSEVFSAITVLRAVANPYDRVALYGALRSIFFGLSDEDLLRARIEGQPLSYLQEVPGNSALARPYSVLRQLHLRRHDRAASETLEMLLLETGAREVLAARPGGLQSIANIGKLARMLRTFQQSSTFGEVVELLCGMEEEGVSESESRIVEERGNAVRILTIHKAKGLDFPIVILAGLGHQKKHDLGSFLVSLHEKKFYAISAGGAKSGLQTPGWKELEEDEKKREKAELLRLLYVALTRARDHLVISTHSGWRWEGEETKWVRNFSRTRLEPLGDFVDGILTAPSPLARLLDANALDSASGSPVRETPPQAVECREALQSGYRELRRLICDTPCSRDLRPPAEKKEGPYDVDESREERWVEAARSRAIRLGIAFHEAIEVADFQSEEGLQGWAAEAGKRNNLDEEGIRRVGEMLSTCLASGLIRRASACAARGGRIWRELSYVRPIPDSGAIEEGKIDLIFEEDGEWVIVDYKTDRIPQGVPDIGGFFREKYSGQIQEYAGAVRDLGLKVEAAYLLLARTGEEIEIPL